LHGLCYFLDGVCPCEQLVGWNVGFWQVKEKLVKVPELLELCKTIQYEHLILSKSGVF
jgi:hypothetical protein